MEEKKRILVVDDEKIARDNIVIVLSLLGYAKQAIYASTPQEALKMYADNKDNIALLITDYDMHEEMKGIDLIKELRKQGFSGAAILQSGNTNQPKLKRDLDLVSGDNCFHDKGDPIAELEKIITRKMNLMQSHQL